MFKMFRKALIHGEYYYFIYEFLCLFSILLKIMYAIQVVVTDFWYKHELAVCTLF